MFHVKWCPMLISGSKLRKAELQQLSKENPCLWEQVISVLSTCVMFSLYYYFPRKLDKYYKSGKYFQMHESYGLGLFFNKSVTVLLLTYSSLPVQGIFAFLQWDFQMKQSMAERWALNKYKYRTAPSRKIITCACFYFSEKFFCTAENILFCRCSNTTAMITQANKEKKMCFCISLSLRQPKSWGLGTDLHYKLIFILQKLSG